MNRIPLPLLLLLAACAAGDDPGPGPAAPTVPADFYQEASWSPDSRELYLTRFIAGRYRLEAVRADGSRLRRLTDGPDSWTSVSPDGGRIAFHSRRDGNGEIYLADRNLRSPRNLTRDPALDTAPVWSPDGSRIAFTSDRDGHQQTYVMDPSGEVVLRVGRSAGDEHHPAWSPDGEWLAVFTTVQTDDGAEDWIDLLRADGTERRRLTRGTYPTWSPGGRLIAFDRDHDLRTIHANGENERLLMREGFCPRWSPDGRTIAFIRGRWPESRVVLLDMDCVCVRPLLSAGPTP